MAAPARAENPILWQEATHQERNAPRWMRWGRPAGIVALAAILMLAPMMLALGDGYSAIQIGLLSIWVVHTGTALRAIIAGANTVSREHVGLTWDTLVLTGVSARQILLGKWRAALRRVGGWMLALGVVRLVMLPVHMVGLVKIYAWVMCGPYAYGAANGSSYCASGVEFDWVPWAALVAVVATVLMTLLDVLCCTAVGMAASALTRRGTLASVLAISIRFAPVATFAAFTRYEIGTTFWRWWRYTPFALADGGTTPLMELTFPVFSWTRASHENALPGLFLSGLLLVSLLAVAVIAAWIAIRRTGALPPVRNFAKTLRRAPKGTAKQQAAVTAVKGLGYDYVGYHILNPTDPPSLSLAAQAGPAAVQAMVPPKSELNGVIGWVAKNGQSKIVNPGDELNHILIEKNRYSAGACIPVGTSLRFGVIFACREQPSAIKPENVLILELISAQLAAALAKKQRS